MENISIIISLIEEDEKSNNDTNYSSHPTSIKKSHQIAKPDLSPLLIRETQFGFKTYGCYKRKKFYESDSPIKNLNKVHSTHTKIEGKDLFNSKNVQSHCRKLNFNEEEEGKIYTNINSKEINEKLSNDFYFNLYNKTFLNKNDQFLKLNKMDNEFKVLKTLKKSKLDFVYKVEEKVSKNVYCIKKIYKNSQKNNINNAKKLFIDMKNKISFKDICKDNSILGSNFCNHYKDFWEEDENLDLILEESYIPTKYLYILYDYYPNGDLLNYLEKLEKINYIFTSDFYWDIIFEMIMGLKYFHGLGYLHLDIKPTNFLVDQNGCIKLSDFGLCQKITDVPFLTDIIEGDKVYISKELLNFNSKGVLNTKADIFSLGLSILEIIGKINLPLTGDSWLHLRSANFQMNDNLLRNSNIKEKKDNFVKLISKMIAPIDKRADLNEIINNFDDLKKRYELLKKNEYKKSGNFLN